MQAELSSYVRAKAEWMQAIEREKVQRHREWMLRRQLRTARGLAEEMTLLGLDLPGEITKLTADHTAAQQELQRLCVAVAEALQRLAAATHALAQVAITDQDETTRVIIGLACAENAYNEASARNDLAAFNYNYDRLEFGEEAAAPLCEKAEQAEAATFEAWKLRRAAEKVVQELDRVAQLDCSSISDVHTRLFVLVTALWCTEHDNAEVENEKGVQPDGFYDDWNANSRKLQEATEAFCAAVLKS